MESNIFLEHLILPLAVALMVYFTPLIHKYLKGKRNISKRNPLVYFDLKGDVNNKIKFYCQLFQKISKKGKFKGWYSHLGEPIELQKLEENRWGIEAELIRNSLKNEKDPFKCFCIVPIEDKNKYYSILCNSGLTVTGMGQKSKVKSKWEIWFLIGKENHHPKILGISGINNKL
jgi:hypothetical protein